MALSFKEQREIYARLNPHLTLEPSNPLNVDLDAMGSTDGRVRGLNWAQRLRRRITMSEEPVCAYFSGLSGSGKSTELRRLAELLRLHEGYHVVLIDSEQSLSLTTAIDLSDLLMVVVHETEKAVLAWEGADPSLALRTGYLTRLWTWLTRTDITLGTGEFAVGSAVKLDLEMKTRAPLREKIQQVVGQNLSAFLEDVRNTMAELAERAIKANTEVRGLVVVVDSLERNDGTAQNFAEVRAKAAQLFITQRSALALPVHVIYTVPPYLLSFEPTLDLDFMPMIKLRTRTGAPFPLGHDAAKALIYQRVSRLALQDIIGPDADVQLERIIEGSGGYPREFIRLVRELLLEEQLPVGASGVDRALNKIRDAFEIAVSAQDYTWLADVHVSKSLVVEGAEQRRSAERMLAMSAVLRYLNNSDWFDVHPLVLRIPGVKGAIERRRAAVQTT